MVNCENSAISSCLAHLYDPCLFDPCHGLCSGTLFFQGSLSLSLMQTQKWQTLQLTTDAEWIRLPISLETNEVTTKSAMAAASVLGSVNAINRCVCVRDNHWPDAFALNMTTFVDLFDIRTWHWYALIGLPGMLQVSQHVQIIWRLQLHSNPDSARLLRRSGRQSKNSFFPSWFRWFRWWLSSQRWRKSFP